MKEGKGLSDAQHDEGEVEENHPERGKHLKENKNVYLKRNSFLSLRFYRRRNG